MLNIKSTLVQSILVVLFLLSSAAIIFDDLYAQSPYMHQSSTQTIVNQNIQIADIKNTQQDIELQADVGKYSVSANNPNSKETSSENSKDNERDIMEDALQFLNESRGYWIKGDLENALYMLDQAYALLLDTDGDPDIARQKDDLRLLISKRILEIYTSKHTATVGKRSAIPYISNADVEKEIRLFQTVERDFFIQSYKRSGLYLPIIQKELKKAGLPEELSWLPLVESGFKCHALSRARALGLWQFIPSTGYKYGLNRDEWVDERLDVEKSTKAAIDYLRELHGMFGDWLTALAAYNCGEGRVLKVISRQHINYFDRFWDLYNQLPNETARYVPRFLATILIIKDPKKYGMDLNNDIDQPYAYEIAYTSKSMRLQDIALHMNVSEDILNTLNSELRQRTTPDKPYALKVPPETAEKLVKVVDEIPQCEKPRQKFAKHKVRRGETVVSIARKYRTSVSAIMAYNHVSSKKKLKSGQRLTIPLDGHSSSYSIVKSSNTPTDSSKTDAGNNVIKYKAKKGDTLASLAKRFDMSAQEIKNINKLRKNSLRTGQIILVNDENGVERGDKPAVKKMSQKMKDNRKAQDKPSLEKGPSKSYTVKKGDNLNKIARESGVSLDKILEVNKLSKKDSIKAGQVLSIE